MKKENIFIRDGWVNAILSLSIVFLPIIIYMIIGCIFQYSDKPEHHRADDMPHMIHYKR